ncbi:MAG: cellulase family glycosylhydrolase [Chitinophagaceae bacterium]|nr:cellulase family glycosylhydrolase [Chitinophagaceae bacterium]
MKTTLPKLAICYCLLLLAVPFNSILAQSSSKYGITLCGAEFGETKLPGILNVDYTYPTETDIDYFVSKGIDLIQLPFKWERIQRLPGDALDINELQMIRKFVDNCAKRNINVVLVLQNFGKYYINNTAYIVGESEVTAWHLRDLWIKLSHALNDKKNIYAFSLMAEPAGLQPCIWVNTVQYVIDGIRAIDCYTTIFVEGNNYSNAATWEIYNDELKNLKDPAKKLVYNAHCYFDYNYSGRYQYCYEKDGANEMTGVERVKPFISWLKKNNLKGFIGEFGIPKNDQKWATVMTNFLNYLQTNNIGGCYWAAGQWWKDYQLSIQPEKNFTDQPQLQLFSKYFNKNKELSKPNSTLIWTRVVKQHHLNQVQIIKA